MVLISLWERYFLKQLILFFLFVLSAFYGLYVLIDYSSRLHSFIHLKAHFDQLFLYYAYTFIMRMEILVPFALVVSTIRTLCQLNENRELVVLMACGIRLKRLLRPFLTVGLICVLLMYLNEQFLLPYAVKQIINIEETEAENFKQDENVAWRWANIEGKSSLFYQKYNSSKQQFYQVWWVQSADKLYHMNRLFLNESEAQLGTSQGNAWGQEVDAYQRDRSGKLVLRGSFDHYSFAGVHFDRQLLKETLTLPEELSLLELWHKLPMQQNDMNLREAELSTVFYRKLIMPWLCLLVVIGAAPFCVHFTRNLSVFFIFFGALVGLVMSYLLFNASVVIGKSQVVPPIAAILIPFAVLWIPFYYRWARVR